MTRNEIINDIIRQAMINAEINVNCIIRQAMINAQINGMVYNGGYGAHNEPCIYWLLDDYVITYLTDDEDFDAIRLSDDMMDELIFEER